MSACFAFLFAFALGSSARRGGCGKEGGRGTPRHWSFGAGLRERCLFGNPVLAPGLASAVSSAVPLTETAVATPKGEEGKRKLSTPKGEGEAGGGAVFERKTEFFNGQSLFLWAGACPSIASRSELEAKAKSRRTIFVPLGELDK